MTIATDDDAFARLLDALGPYVDRVVIVGGWAHRLFRNHALAVPLSYPPLMTTDTDVALPAGVSADEENLRERLLSRGFREEFFGDDRPPVTHYQLGDRGVGFYVEFLTPLLGGEFRRDRRRDVTIAIAGVTAQKLRHLDILLIAPWSVPFARDSLPPDQVLTHVNVANPVTYIVQKLLVSRKRKPDERAKDVLYIHDTVELFARSLPDLRQLWAATVRPALGARTEQKLRQAVSELLPVVTDTARNAARMASGRALSPDALLEVCRAGLKQIIGS